MRAGRMLAEAPKSVLSRTVKNCHDAVHAIEKSDRARDKQRSQSLPWPFNYHKSLLDREHQR